MHLPSIVLQVAIVLLFLEVVGSANSTSHTGRLYTDLMSNYIAVVPDTTAGPVLVELDFLPFQVKGLDGKSQILSTFGQVLMSWIDDDLKWDPQSYGMTYAIEIPIKEIWRPLIGLRNSADAIYDADWPAMFPSFVGFNGLVTWAPAGSFETSCELKMSAFPYDTQMCALDWGTIVSASDTVNVSAAKAEMSMSFYQGSKEFLITKTWTRHKEVPLDTGIGGMISLPSVEFWIELKRKPTYYVLNIIVPTIVLAILSASSFKVPIEAGEKVSLIITIVLSYTVYSLILSDLTPQTSDHTPLLVIYMTWSICAGGLSMVFALIQINMYHRNPVTPLPAWMRRYIIQGLGRYLNHNRPNKIDINDTDKVSRMQTDMKEKVPESQTENSMNNKNGPSMGAERQGDWLVAGLLCEMRKITSKMEEDEAESITRAEWMLAAQITDRLFFFIFAVFQLLLIIVFFGIMPYA